MIPERQVDQYGYCPRHGVPVPADAMCPACLAGAADINPDRRLNIGSGQFPLLYFVNLDASPSAIADVHVRVPPLPFADGAFDEIYAGHFLEHLTPAHARTFLAECLRCLAPGGKLGIVVPDTREVMMRWLRGDLDAVEYPVGVWHAISDLDAVCRMFLYSNVQESGHLWSYDLGTLSRLLQASGFLVSGEIDRYRDPRITIGAWYQCGLDCHKPGPRAGDSA